MAGMPVQRTKADGNPDINAGASRARVRAALQFSLDTRDTMGVTG